jgi:hypothetical protein
MLRGGVKILNWRVGRLKMSDIYYGEKNIKEDHIYKFLIFL